MNIPPPPLTDDLEELRKWCEDLYGFLKNPAFHVIKLVPRSGAPTAEEGNVYYDSDDDKLKVYNAVDWQDTY